MPLLQMNGVKASKVYAFNTSLARASQHADKIKTNYLDHSKVLSAPLQPNQNAYSAVTKHDSSCVITSRHCSKLGFLRNIQLGQPSVDLVTSCHNHANTITSSVEHDKTTQTVLAKTNHGKEICTKVANKSEYNYNCLAESANNYIRGKDSQWLCMFNELKRYKEKYGDCLVPSSYVNSRLARWVRQQRHQYQMLKSGSSSLFSDVRVSLLTNLGFEWSAHDVSWMNHFLELKAYKIENGDCLVPARYAPNPKLGRWVNKQRVKYKYGNMSEDRIRKLQLIGFVWDVKADTS